jgi:hypothetical protein
MNKIHIVPFKNIIRSGSNNYSRIPDTPPDVHSHHSQSTINLSRSSSNLGRKNGLVPISAH